MSNEITAAQPSANHEMRTLYKLRTDKPKGWQTKLNIALLDMAKDKGSSLDEMSEIFYDYYFRESPGNMIVQRSFRRLKRLVRFIPLVGAFLIAVTPIYNFADAVVSQSKTAKSSQIRQSWSALKEYQGQKADYGRKKALLVLNNSNKPDSWQIWLSKLPFSRPVEQTDKILLDGLNLSETYGLSGINLTNASLKHSNFKKAKIHHADLSRSDFYLSNLSEADFESSTLNNSRFFNADLRNSKLFGVHLNHSELQSAMMNGSNLEDAYLVGANLTNANLTWVNLKGANLSGASLARAKLSHAALDRAIFSCIPLIDGETHSKTSENVHILKEDYRNRYSCKKLVELCKEHDDSEKVRCVLDPTKRHLVRANLQYADMRNISHDGNIDSITTAMNWRTAAFSPSVRRVFCGEPLLLNIDKEINFSYYLQRGDFTCFDLRLKHKHNKTHDFTKRDLSGIDFTGSLLNGVRFDGSNLYGAVFTRADVKCTSFIDTGITPSLLKDQKARNVEHAVFTSNSNACS